MDKIKDILKKGFAGCVSILEYARINDEKGRISLTNIALMLMLYKIGMTDATSMKDLTALFIAILGYQSKRVIEKK